MNNISSIQTEKPYKYMRTRVKLSAHSRNEHRAIGSMTLKFSVAGKNNITRAPVWSIEYSRNPINFLASIFHVYYNSIKWTLFRYQYNIILVCRESNRPLYFIFGTFDFTVEKKIFIASFEQKISINNIREKVIDIVNDRHRQS